MFVFCQKYAILDTIFLTFDTFNRIILTIILEIVNIFDIILVEDSFLNN